MSAAPGDWQQTGALPRCAEVSDFLLVLPHFTLHVLIEIVFFKFPAQVGRCGFELGLNLVGLVLAAVGWLSPAVLLSGPYAAIRIHPFHLVSVGLRDCVSGSPVFLCPVPCSHIFDPVSVPWVQQCSGQFGLILLTAVG